MPRGAVPSTHLWTSDRPAALLRIVGGAEFRCGEACWKYECEGIGHDTAPFLNSEEEEEAAAALRVGI